MFLSAGFFLALTNKQIPITGDDGFVPRCPE
jgi:hypothetical protein